MPVKPDFRITRITAFTSIDPKDNSEGVMGARIGPAGISEDGNWLPLICADEERVAYMYPIAETISAVTGQQFRVKQFSVVTDITEMTRYKYGKKKGPGEPGPIT